MLTLAIGLLNRGPSKKQLRKELRRLQWSQAIDRGSIALAFRKANEARAELQAATLDLELLKDGIDDLAAERAGLREKADHLEAQLDVEAAQHRDTCRRLIVALKVVTAVEHLIGEWDLRDRHTFVTQATADAFREVRQALDTFQRAAKGGHAAHDGHAGEGE